MVSPDGPQQTQRAIYHSDDEVPRNDKDEGETEKEGDNVVTNDGGTESKEEDVLYTADERAAWQRFHVVLKESNVKHVCDVVLWFAVLIQTNNIVRADHNHHHRNVSTPMMFACSSERGSE